LVPVKVVTLAMSNFAEFRGFSQISGLFVPNCPSLGHLGTGFVLEIQGLAYCPTFAIFVPHQSSAKNSKDQRLSHGKPALYFIMPASMQQYVIYNTIPCNADRLQRRFRRF